MKRNGAIELWKGEQMLGKCVACNQSAWFTRCEELQRTRGTEIEYSIEQMLLQ